MPFASMRVRAAAFLSLLAVAACGPMYDTQYYFTAPSDPTGRQLAGQCRVVQNMCKQNCQMRENACRSDARARGMAEYHAYVEKRRRENMPLKRDLNSFISDSSCGSSSCEDACEAEYRSCYVEAGGKVRSKQVCVAFCEEDNKKK